MSLAEPHWWRLVPPLMEIPPLEKVLRTVAVYLVIALLLRVFGKRELAQLTSFDLVVMLLLSNVVQNAIIGPDNSLIGGLLGATILILFNNFLVRVTIRRGTHLFESEPITLADAGRFDQEMLRRLGLRAADVEVALKRQGANTVADTQSVTLEPGGAVVMRLRPDEEPASAADIRALHDRLDRIERLLAR